MSEEQTVTATETQGAAQGERTFTQEEVNRLIGERVNKVNAKYADYPDLKAKAAKYDELQEASKSETEKLMDRVNRAESERDEMRAAIARRDLLDKVSKETGVPSNLLKGDTEEELVSSARQIAEFAKASEPGIPKDKGGAASQKNADDGGDWLRAAITRR